MSPDFLIRPGGGYVLRPDGSKILLGTEGRPPPTRTIVADRDERAPMVEVEIRALTVSSSNG